VTPAEQSVDVTVVATRELHDLRAAGRAAGESHRGHRGLGARRHEPELLEPRDAFAHHFRQLDLAAGGGAVGGARPGRALHGFDDGRIRVPENRCSPRLHVVDIATTVGVEQVGAFAPLGEERFAADRGERPHRRVHTARNAREGPFVEITHVFR